jgi:hypothetical protein
MEQGDSQCSHMFHLIITGRFLLTSFDAEGASLAISLLHLEFSCTVINVSRFSEIYEYLGV